MPHFTFDTYIGLIGIALSLVAIIMAVQSFFQMNWGRPQIRIGFEEGHEEGRTVWLGSIQNEPIKNSFLKKIGVRREPVPVRSTFQIFKSTGDLVVQRVFVLLRSAEGTRSEQIELCAPLSCPIYHCSLPKRQQYNSCS